MSDEKRTFGFTIYSNNPIKLERLRDRVEEEFLDRDDAEDFDVDSDIMDFGEVWNRDKEGENG